MATTAQLRRLWSPVCKFEKRTLTLHSGARITVNAATTDAWKAIDELKIPGQDATEKLRNLMGEPNSPDRVYQYTRAMENARDAIAALMEAAKVEHGEEESGPDTG